MTVVLGSFISFQHYGTKVYFESHVVTAAEQLLMCAVCFFLHISERLVKQSYKYQQPGH